MKTKPYKTSDYLKTNEERAAYIAVAIEEGDDRLFLLAIREVIDSLGGMAQLADKTGLARESLYRAFGKNGNPQFTTISKVLNQIGLRISVSAK